MSILTYAVTMPNGKPGEYGVIVTPNQAVTIVALDNAGRVALIHEERFPVAKDCGAGAAALRLPMGSVIDSSEPPLDAAKRELREEAGLEADEWHEIGRFAPMSGLCSEVALVYIAQGAHVASEADPDGNEGISDAVQWLPLEGVLPAMMASNEVVDGQSATAVTMAGHWLQMAEPTTESYSQ